MYVYMYAQPASQSALEGSPGYLCVLSPDSDLHISIFALRDAKDKAIGRDDRLQRGG